MRKIMVLGLLTLSMLIITSCAVKNNCLVEGTYESIDSTESYPISRAKYILKEITEETYNLANSVNVIEDYTYSNNHKYYSFDLLFFLDFSNSYVRIDTHSFKYVGGSHSLYNAALKYQSDIFSIEESFSFDCSSNSIFWFDDNGTETRFNFIFTNNNEA